MKCPHCENPMTAPFGQVGEVSVGMQQFKGVVYYCPSCQSVLGCQIDPILLAQQIADLVVKKIHQSQ
jgi:hypothetical protein